MSDGSREFAITIHARVRPRLARRMGTFFFGETQPPMRSLLRDEPMKRPLHFVIDLRRALAARRVRKYAPGAAARGHSRPRCMTSCGRQQNPIAPCKLPFLRP